MNNGIIRISNINLFIFNFCNHFSIHVKTHLLEQNWKLYIKAIFVHMMKYTCTKVYYRFWLYKKECPETNKVNTQFITRFFKVIY